MTNRFQVEVSNILEMKLILEQAAKSEEVLNLMTPVEIAVLNEQISQALGLCRAIGTKIQLRRIIAGL